MEHLEKELLRISPNSAVQNWTEDAAGDDYWMALDGDEDVVVAIHHLIKNNLEKANRSKNEYIRYFAKCIQENPKDFQTGINQLESLNKKMPIFEQEEYKKHMKKKKKRMGISKK